jgi:hypothetical protein
MGDRYWHELCFTGPKDADALIDAAREAGFRLEFGAMQRDEDFVGLPVQLASAERRIAELERALEHQRGYPAYRVRMRSNGVSGPKLAESVLDR